MREIAIHQVDAFTDQLFGGNPAGVVTNAEQMTEAEMQQVAREMNLSETAFVLPPSSDEVDVRLRFFTPSSEVKFCGHATVGALFQLSLLGLYGLGRQGRNDVNVQTGAGILPMTVMNEGVKPEIGFTAPPVKLAPYRLQGEAFADAFGVSPELIKPDATVLRDDVLNYLYVPAASLQSLRKQQFDFGRIRDNFGDEGIVVFCLFSNETIGKHADLHARGLAPNVGVDEDPFTGSMQAGLIRAAQRNGYIDPSQQAIITEQGHFVGRPGFARVSRRELDGNVTITANAVPVFSATMELQ